MVESTQDAVRESVTKLQVLGIHSDLYENITRGTQKATTSSKSRKETRKPSNHLKSQYAGSFTVEKIAAVTSLTLAAIERALRLYLLMEYTDMPPHNGIETADLPSLDSQKASGANTWKIKCYLNFFSLQVQVFKTLKIIYHDVQLPNILHTEFCRCTPRWHNGTARNDFALIVEDANKIGYERVKNIGILK